jgi:peroxiredoxin
MHAWLIAALVVAWVLVAVLVGLLYVLVAQHGKVLIHLRELEQEYIAHLREGDDGPAGGDEPPPGLPVGVEAPPFELPDLAGAERRLEDYRGSEIVVAFFSPYCGYCRQMSPRLGKLSKTGRRVVLITQGEVADNTALADEDSWRCDVVRDDDWRVYRDYAVIGTPSGYLVDADGRIASQLAIGADAVLGLLEAEPAGFPVAVGASGNGHEPGFERSAAAGMPLRDTSDSRLVRDGLKAGTIAPNFVLPGLDGETHSLVDYHGKQVLLVFSAPDCGPCDELAPALVELAERRPAGLEIVMVSRGGVDENRRKANENGYPFRVLLQRRWEISKEYGMFATPIGYLIGADGVIERDVAVGRDAILSLAEPV